MSQSQKSRDEIVEEAHKIWDNYWRGHIIDHSGKYLPLPEMTLEFPEAMVADPRWPEIKEILRKIPFKCQRTDDFYGALLSYFHELEENGSIPKGFFNDKLQYICQTNPIPDILKGAHWEKPLAVIVDLVKKSEEKLIIQDGEETLLFCVLTENFENIRELVPVYCHSARDISFRGAQSAAGMCIVRDYGEYIWQAIPGCHEYIIDNRDGSHGFDGEQDPFLASMLLFVSLLNNVGNMLLTHPAKQPALGPGCPVS